jgi:hypothetical protein
MIGLISLIRDTKLKNINEWPSTYNNNNNNNTISTLIHDIIRILYIPFIHSVDQHILARIQKMIYNQMLVRHLIVSMRMLKVEELEMPVGKLYLIVV